MTPLITCPNCLHRNVFASLEALEHHLLAGHYRCFAHECEECRGLERFATKARLEQHLRDDHGKVEYQIRFAPSNEERFKMEQVERALRACYVPPNRRGGVGGVLALTYRQPAAAPVGRAAMPIKRSPTHDTGRANSSAGGRLVAALRSPKGRQQPLVKKPTAKKTVGAAGGGPIRFGKKRATSAAIAAVAKHLCLKRVDSLGRKQMPPRQCVQCKEMVCGAKNSLLHHINTKHLRLMLRSCRLCEQSFDSYPVIGIYAHLAHKHKMVPQSGKAEHIETNKAAMARVESQMEAHFPKAI